MPVIVGTGTNVTHTTIERTRQAMILGADGVLLVTPYYNKPTQEGLYQHYRAIAQAVPIPQILYNVPSRTGCDLLPDTVKRLTRFSNIVALKEASSIERAKHLLTLSDCKIDVLSGDDVTAMECILAGGKGVISVAANIAPGVMYNMVHAALQGDVKQARAYDEQLRSLYSGLFVESNPIPVKWMLSKMGLIESGIRLPLTPLSLCYHANLRQIMQKFSDHNV